MLIERIQSPHISTYSRQSQKEALQRHGALSEDAITFDPDEHTKREQGEPTPRGNDEEKQDKQASEIAPQAGAEINAAETSAQDAKAASGQKSPVNVFA